MDINKILNNPENMYLGHGTGSNESQKINSIIKNGLRCSRGSLYWTSVALGLGTKIEDSEQRMMKNWPHKGSTTIIIVSLPIKYNIIDSIELDTYNQAYSAFYYIPDEKTREREELTNSPYVIPEFIVGYYNAEDDSFTDNPRYYERLSQNEQEKLFKQVKENYYEIIEEGCGFEYYQEILTDLNHKCPLTCEEIELFKKKKLEKELFKIIPEEILKKMLSTPSGNKILAEEYIKELVLPFIPIEGNIVLKSGIELPITHFILECVLYDCQERYNGDFAKYLKENVDIEKTEQINNTQKKENKKR